MWVCINNLCENNNKSVLSGCNILKYSLIKCKKRLSISRTKEQRKKEIEEI